MPLSKKEIDSLLEKLRERYKDYAGKYNPSWFNVEAFEERYAMAIENRMNLEGFMLAEISNFEKIKEKYDKKKKSRDFSSKVDRIIEENTERIKKYPRNQFHPLAGLEITYFYGAVSEFAVYYFSLMWLIVKNFDFREKIDIINRKLDVLAIPHGRTFPKRINDHVFKLKQGVSSLEIERDSSDYMRESAFVLHNILDLCDRLMDLKETDWENPLLFNKLYVEDDIKKRIIEIFSGLTGYGAILAVKEKAGGIIEDFRLGAFKRNDIL